MGGGGTMAFPNYNRVIPCGLCVLIRETVFLCQMNVEKISYNIHHDKKSLLYNSNDGLE